MDQSWRRTLYRLLVQATPIRRQHNSLSQHATLTVFQLPERYWHRKRCQAIAGVRVLVAESPEVTFKNRQPLRIQTASHKENSDANSTQED